MTIPLLHSAVRHSGGTCFSQADLIVDRGYLCATPLALFVWVLRMATTCVAAVDIEYLGWRH